MSRGTILIIGREDDPCCKAVRGELDASGQAVLFLQEDAILPGLRFVWEPGCPAPRGQVGQSDRVISLSDVRGVLCRSFGVPVPLEEFYSPDGRYVTAEWNALLMAWLSALECSVVNRLRPELWYKIRLDPPDLAALVPGLPFRLPRNLVTTRSDMVQAFCESSRGAVEYTALTQSGRYPIRNEADQRKLATLSDWLPLRLSERPEGVELDAFVVRDTVVVAGPDGQSPVRLPSSIEAACVQAGRKLGLLFYRVSLTDCAGEWYWRELDRMPQLYGCTTGVLERIAAALAGVLQGGSVP